MQAKGRRVGIAVDGSENSNKAVDWYFNSLAEKGDYVIFIHVQEYHDLPAFAAGSGFNIPADHWMKIINER